MKTVIVISLQVEGLHFWESCDLKEVMFLKNKHRHIFHIKCKKEVSHADRETEIILFKRKIVDFLHLTFDNGSGVLDFDGMSCEMIASVLVGKFNLHSCEVLEDNENGAEVFNG